MQNEAKGTKVVGATSLEDMVSKLKKPRRVMLLVKAGQAVDAFIDKLVREKKTRAKGERGGRGGGGGGRERERERVLVGVTRETKKWFPVCQGQTVFQCLHWQTGECVCVCVLVYMCMCPLVSVH